MDPKKSPVYREWTPWAAWLQIVFWGTMFVAMVAVSLAERESDEERLVGIVVLALTALSVQLLVSGLSVRLFHEHMVVGLGTVGLISKKIRYEDIVRTESVTYRPISEFGGWGVRFGKDRKRAWTARGNHAVVLHLRDGVRLYVGSDRPHRLEERIRAVAGTRIGG